MRFLSETLFTLNKKQQGKEQMICTFDSRLLKNTTIEVVFKQPVSGDKRSKAYHLCGLRELLSLVVNPINRISTLLCIPAIAGECDRYISEENSPESPSIETAVKGKRNLCLIQLNKRLIKNSPARRTEVTT